MPNPLLVESLSLSGQNITAVGNHIYINGINAIAGISGNAPATSSLTVPISIETFGGLNNLLGRPAGWLQIPVSGLTYKIPFYN